MAIVCIVRGAEGRREEVAKVKVETIKKKKLQQNRKEERRKRSLSESWKDSFL